jgi:fermentation-respiration switch protein FrsA (DUF1100 family)
MKKSAKAVAVGFSLLILLVVVAVYVLAFLTADRLLSIRRTSDKLPSEYGLEYESIEFSSTDGIPLKGWWIPANSSATIVVIHGFGANRAGVYETDKSGNRIYVDHLAVAPYLHRAGYNLLYLDLRASGASGGDRITLGYHEPKDVEGAVDWLLSSDGRTAPDGRIGLLGFSMGANVALRSGILLRGLLEQGRIERAAVVAINNYRFDTMAERSVRFWAAKTGIPLTESFIGPVKQMASLMLGFDPSREIDPSAYTAEISPIPLLFVGSMGDEIGNFEDVRAAFLAAREPKELITVPGPRYQGYNLPGEKPELFISFYDKHLR